MPSDPATTARPARAARRGPALLKRSGPLLEISRDGDEPLPHGALLRLLPELEYDHTTLLFGMEARDRHSGERRGARVDRVRLYQFDAHGRLVTGSGYLDRVYRFLVDAGHQVGWVDATPASPRPDVFVPRPERLARHPEFSARPGDREHVARIRAGGPPADPEDGEAVAIARRVVQGEFLDVVVRRAAKGMGSVCQLPPGSGKSFAIACLSMLLPKARIVLAVPDVDNFNKSWRHLTRYMADVGRLGDGHKDHRRVTVCTFGSLHHVDDDVDLVVVDEAHKAAAADASDKLGVVAPRAVRVGLTATPEGRMDGADGKLECLFGPVAYRMTWPEATALGLVVPIAVRWLSMDLPHNPAAGHQGVFRKKFGIWRNRDRNARIAAAARQIPDGDQALIMVSTIEHAVHLGKLLPGYQLVYGSHDLEQFERYADADLLADGFEPVTRERREQHRLAFEAEDLKRVIATDVWSTGVSFDALPHLIRADARASTILDEQIPGRVSRAHSASGKRSGELFDCLDEFDRGFASAARSRSKNYRSKGWSEEFPARKDGPR